MAAVSVMALLPAAASAAPPAPDNGGYETFICPATSLHNDRGLWVVGSHGAYYVQILTRGTPEPMKANKVFVKVNDQGHAVEQAQVPAGYALYGDVFPEGYFVTGRSGGDVAMLLGEGIDNWLPSDSTCSEGAMVTVEAVGDGTFRVTDAMDKVYVEFSGLIPLAAGVFW